MSSFKSKSSNKKIKPHKHDITTVDSKHSEMMSIFDEEKNKLPFLKVQMDAMNYKLKTENLPIHEHTKLYNDIYDLKQRIKKIKKSEKEYLLENISLVSDYFKDKQQTSTGKPSKNIKSLEFFFFSSVKEEESNPLKNLSISQKYLQKMDPDFIDTSVYTLNLNTCDMCGGELIIIEFEGTITCKKCGQSEQIIIDNDKPSFKEPPKEVCFYAYKRINHFREILAQFQGKETTNISEEIILKIEAQIKKSRYEKRELVNDIMKEILKNIECSELYEHLTYIRAKLGIKPPVLPYELESVLCNLFILIQPSYAKYCPKNRYNFLNYNFVLYKLLELLDQNMYLPLIPLLKDDEKINEQDDVWEKICSDFDWLFISTNNLCSARYLPDFCLI